MRNFVKICDPKEKADQGFLTSRKYQENHPFQASSEITSAGPELNCGYSFAHPAAPREDIDLSPQDFLF